MSHQTTIGYSLLSSGIVTLLLTVLPGGDVAWGIGLIALGAVVIYFRQSNGF